MGGPRSGGLYFWEGVGAAEDVIAGLGDTGCGCLDVRSVTLGGALAQFCGPHCGGLYFWEGVGATEDVVGGLGDTEIGCLDARSVTLEGQFRAASSCSRRDILASARDMRSERRLFSRTMFCINGERSEVSL